MTSPFAPLRPAFALAGAYAGAAVLWVLAGSVLPGGRWFAVHLFTLGVLTTLVVALTDHFAQTLLHAPQRRHPAARPTLSASARCSCSSACRRVEQPSSPPVRRS